MGIKKKHSQGVEQFADSHNTQANATPQEHYNKKDWTGNARSAFTQLGASNHATEERQVHDFYATEPKALDLLLDDQRLQFSENVWECACGQGHLSEVLKKRGHNVLSTDLYDYGYGISGMDFLTQTEITLFDGDIITNPPYKYALEFVRRAYDIVQPGHKVAMFLKVTFLESKKRRELFDTTPPIYIYISSSRLNCAKNGDFIRYGEASAAAYAWFVWEKGFSGEPRVRWFN